MSLVYELTRLLKVTLTVYYRGLMLYKCKHSWVWGHSSRILRDKDRSYLSSLGDFYNFSQK